MSLDDFITVKVQIGNKIQTIKMEKGVSFQNKGGIFTADKNGQTIKMTNYQMQVFQAVANNNLEQGLDGIVLSKKDIEEAIQMYSRGALGYDLAEKLKGGYKVKNPKAFKDENKISAYITNGSPNTSAVLSFQYSPSDADNTVKPVSNDSSKVAAPEVQTTSKVFSSPCIIEQKAFKYKVKKGDTVISLAKQYEIDTYQLIAANPQLKEGKDYKVHFRKNNIATMTSNLTEGQVLTIPARYSVREGSVKNFNDLCRITGLSRGYIEDLLTVIEVKASHPGEPDLRTYDDGFGTPTIGYGHTGKFQGKELSLRKKVNITKEQALQLLAEDLIKHEAMVVSYLGKENYEKAPASVRAAIVDVAYNKGIWDGFLNPHHNSCTSKIKSDLESRNYASALCHTLRMNTPSRGLKRRNIYRFISGLTDLTPAKRESAMKETTKYYNSVMKTLSGAEKTYMKSAWENAKLGKTTGYRIQYSQKDRK